jgi:hypothetical protein
VSQGPRQSRLRREEQGPASHLGPPESTSAPGGLPGPLGSLGVYFPEAEKCFDRTIEGSGQGKGSSG